MIKGAAIAFAILAGPTITMLVLVYLILPNPTCEPGWTLVERDHLTMCAHELKEPK